MFKLLCIATAFLLSSDPVVQERQPSLQGMESFVFFPLLKIEAKQQDRVLQFLDLELNKVGTASKIPVLNTDGADLEHFSHPTLQFLIEELVDANNKPLSILRATLSIRTTAQVDPLNSLASLSTNHWSMYLKKNK